MTRVARTPRVRFFSAPWTITALALIAGGCASHTPQSQKPLSGQAPAQAPAADAIGLQAQRSQGIDPASAATLNEDERKAILEHVVQHLRDASIAEDTATVADLCVSLLPDDESMKAFLSDSAPPSVRQHLKEQYDEQRAHLRDPDRAARLLVGYAGRGNIEAFPISLADRPNRYDDNQWKTWFRPDVKLYEVGYERRSFVSPFFWDGRRWVNLVDVEFEILYLPAKSAPSRP